MPLQGLANELVFMKENDAKCSFDKVGHADFTIAAACTAIQWA
jgi:hypothetical protein